MSRFGFKSKRGDKKNIRGKSRNAERLSYRTRHPEHRGKQLNVWPLPDADARASAF